MQNIRRITEKEIDKDDVTIINKIGNPIMEQGQKKIYLTVNDIFSITEENANKRPYNLDYIGHA